MKGATTYSIGDLAAAAGVSRRTVRFYVQQGLLPAPLGLGRGAHYDEAHLAVLLRVKHLQLQGVPLAQIGAGLASWGQPAGEGAPEAPRRSLSDDQPALDSGRRTAAAPPVGAVGDVLFRQPLAPGYDLIVTPPGRPLSPGELAELGELLSTRFHNRSREDR